MEFFRKQTEFQFMKYRAIWLSISAVLVGLSLYLWMSTGDKKYGVEFVGGGQVNVEFDGDIETGTVRSAVEGAGMENASVQAIKSNKSGVSSFTIGMKASEGVNFAHDVEKALASVPNRTFRILETQVVGPTIGEQIKRSGLIAFVLALVAIMIYVTVQFDLSFAVGAVVALFHDVIVTAGIFLFTGREISGAFLAAALTIVGYSVNDTIVIFDRVRENIARAMKTGTARKQSAAQGLTDLSKVIDLSVNQTLSRSILTSLTVFMTAVTMWLVATGSASDLAFALVIGVITGSYSTIFIASPIVVFWRRLRAARA